MRLQEGSIGLMVLSLFSLFLVRVVALPAGGAEARVSTRTGVSTPAAPRELRVRFHRLWLRTAQSHSGWERGLWLRGPRLADDYARRAALVRFLRTELVPYVARERTDAYAASGAIFDRRLIENLVERLDATARSPDTRDFRNTAYALRIVVDDYFAKDHAQIQKVRAPAPRMDARRMTVAGR